MSEYREEDVEEDAGSPMLSQLATSPRMLAKADIDMRKLTVLRGPEAVPTSVRHLLYFMGRNDVTIRKIPVYVSLVDNLLNILVGVNGRGRQDVIRAVQVQQGQAVSLEAEIQSRRPGFVGQYITNRNWEEEERKKLGVE